MKHRDRVLTALNHQEPDRCPMQISFTPEFAVRLESDLQLKGQGLHNPHGGGNTYELERPRRRYVADLVGWVNGILSERISRRRQLSGRVGCHLENDRIRNSFRKGKYTEPFGSPLADDQALDAYKRRNQTVLLYMPKPKALSEIIKTYIGSSALRQQPFSRRPGRCAATKDC